jgi:hypothetical protein
MMRDGNAAECIADMAILFGSYLQMGAQALFVRVGFVLVGSSLAVGLKRVFTIFCLYTKYLFT